MSLTFVVGIASDVFGGSLATAVESELAKRFAPLVANGEEPYRSDPVHASGWRKLQQLAASMLGAESIPQLAKVDPYQAVYVMEAGSAVDVIPIANAADPLHAGRLPELLDELRRFAATASLPTDDVELMQLAAHYLENEDAEKDLDVQTYVQLMLSAKQAAARGQALWVVT
ncbi:MAG TPA: hypothetical protein VFN10_20275 [Thermoanaerobaculia bacterium]|nr:hypothetical protein [Thermoanaerobaculia bacterium]